MTATYHGQRHRTGDKRNMHELNKKLRAVSLAEEESNRRNQELLKTLGKVSKQATTLSNKTERLKKVRGDYEDYVSRLYPQWVGYMGKLNQQQSPPPKEECGTRMRNGSLPKETLSKHQTRQSRSQEKDLFSEFMQNKMNRWRHDTSLDNSPERPYVSPDRPQINARTSSPSYNHHIGQCKSYSSPPTQDERSRRYRRQYDDFSPSNEFNQQQMHSISRGDEPYRTQSEPFLPVRKEFAKIHRYTRDDEPLHEEKTFTNQQSISDLLLNNSINNAQTCTDLSGITILPQLLGVGQNGQLVLVPLATSLNLNSSLNDTLNDLNGAAKRRASPVGQNSESVNQTYDDNQQQQGVKTNGIATQNVSVLQLRHCDDHPNSGSFNDKIKAERENQRLHYIELQRLEKEKQKRLQEEERDQRLQDEKQRWRELEKEIERKKLEEEREKAEKLKYQKDQKDQKQEQEKMLKPQESPALKKQKSPMFSKLKSLAKFSPSTKRDSKQDSPAVAVVVNEAVKEPSKDEEAQEDQPPSFFGDDDDDDLFPDDDSEDESDLRLHTKSMSRAISDIEELSENSSRQTPKKKSPSQSPRSSKPVQSTSTPSSVRQPAPQRQEPSPIVSPLNNNNNNNTRSTNDSLTNNPMSIKESSPVNNNTKSNKDSSLFSDFSDHSEFDLKSNKSASSPSQSNVPPSPPPPASVNKQPPLSPPVPALQKQRTFSQDSQGDAMEDDYQPLLYIMETLIDKVKDEESEEVLVLNIDIDTNQANTIIGTAELEGNVNQFDSSDLCMSYRYHLQQSMIKRSDRPFLIDDVDVNNDFEGNLRDCVDSCYLEIWDSLFIFLTEIMSAFEFDPFQVATIFGNVLLPSPHEKQRKQFQASLGKILTHLSEESFYTEDESEAVPMATSKISITEEILTRGGGGGNTSKSDPLTTTYGVGGKSATENGDLSQTLSLDNEDDTSSTVSFDSDGLPVRRSKHKNQPELDSISQNNSTLSEASSNLNLNGSKAYQEMRHESLMSPVHEDIDDDDDDALEDLLGESIGLNRRPQTTKVTSPPPGSYSKGNNNTTNNVSRKSSTTKMTPSNDLITRSESSTSKSKKKMDVKKPDFWDTESESDFDLSNNTGRSGNESKQQQQQQQQQQVKNEEDEDDDFDFDFYD